MKSVISDFESGLLNACEIELPGAKKDACFFHLRQCWKRALNEYNLTKKFLQDQSFKFSFNCLSALAFVKPEDVEHCFDLLLNHQDFHPDLKRYAERYFKPTWIRQDDGVKPRYSSDTWNVYERCVFSKIILSLDPSFISFLAFIYFQSKLI